MEAIGFFFVMILLAVFLGIPVLVGGYFGLKLRRVLERDKAKELARIADMTDEYRKHR